MQFGNGADLEGISVYMIVLRLPASITELWCVVLSCVTGGVP